MQVIKQRNRTAPNGFYKAVVRYLGNVSVSPQHVSAVRKGQRKNDALLLAIITVDHYWKDIDGSGFKRLTF